MSQELQLGKYEFYPKEDFKKSPLSFEELAAELGIKKEAETQNGLFPTPEINSSFVSDSEIVIANGDWSEHQSR